MATMAERARRMLGFPGVIKKEAAEAMGVSPSAVSRILRGERKITADEFARFELYFRGLKIDGLEEPPAPAISPAPALSPVYPARAISSGEWVVDLAADAGELLPAPRAFQGFAEVFGFRAPDESAWPRFKRGEIVWISPTEAALPGDDAFISSADAGARSLRGRIAEIGVSEKNKTTIRDFKSGSARPFDRSTQAIFKIAPRDA
jgi:transcriptional regulator with XRE-family HTH domain